MPEERLQRALARAGVGSRRSSEELIEASRVTVNGRVASLGDRIDAERDEVRVDGELTNRLLHPRYGVEKEYLAEVTGTPTDRRMARLVRGVHLEDGAARARSARVVARSGGRAGVRLVMAEGRKREVRRMLEAVGLPVRRLVRLRQGPIRLGRLQAGELRELD